MKDEEIKAEMAKYTEALNQGKYNLFKQFDVEKDGVPPEAFFGAKENAHKIAMECLNKILTPELKVFVKNLCFDRLAYPDDPIFYKAFGEYPKIGDKISVAELENLGIDEKEFWERADDIWFHEHSCAIDFKEIDGTKYYVIEYLEEESDADSKERKEWLKKTSRAMHEISKIPQVDKALKEKLGEVLKDDNQLIGKMSI